MKHHVFVYGSLKKGHFNDDLLDDSKLIGVGKMVDGNYSLYSLGIFPAIVRRVNGNGVFGEVYLVNEETLGDLDILEGHPTYYKRERKDVLLDNGVTINCFVYIFQGKVSNKSIISSGVWS